MHNNYIEATKDGRRRSKMLKPKKSDEKLIKDSNSATSLRPPDPEEWNPPERKIRDDPSLDISPSMDISPASASPSHSDREESDVDSRSATPSVTPDMSPEASPEASPESSPAPSPAPTLTPTLKRMVRMTADQAGLLFSSSPGKKILWFCSDLLVGYFSSTVQYFFCSTELKSIYSPHLAT